MGRFIVIAWLSLSLAGLVFGGLCLKNALSTPKTTILFPSTFEMHEAAVVSKPVERRFPPIFGTPREIPVAVVTSARTHPDIKLIGTMILGETRHAFLETPDGQIAVREGEQLDGSAEIKRIEDSQIDILFEGRIVSIDIGTSDTSSRRMDKFQQRPPAMQAAREADAATPVRISHRMSQEEVLALLQDPRSHSTAFASR